jgi:hypothetical protein
MVKRALAVASIVLVASNIDAQQCLHGESERPEQRVRREQALRLAHQINLAQMSVPRALNEAPRFRPLDELPNIPAAPPGFDVSLVTDGRSYSFSIKDVQDPCRFAIFSDQGRWIYEGTPTRQAVILPAKEMRD